MRNSIDIIPAANNKSHYNGYQGIAQRIKAGIKGVKEYP